MKLTVHQLNLFGLCFGCPEIKPLAGCHIEKYRNMTALKKMNFVEGISTDEAKNLMDQHQKCLIKRMNDNVILKSI